MNTRLFSSFLLLAALLASCGQRSARGEDTSPPTPTADRSFAVEFSSYEELEANPDLTPAEKDFLRYGSSDPSNAGFYAFARAMGGKDEATRYLEKATEEERRIVFQKYRVGVVYDSAKPDGADVSAAALEREGCPKYYPAAYQGRTHFVRTPQGGTMSIRIDNYGRPNSASMFYPPRLAGTRNAKCQNNVGKWAPTGGYSGGHMIPDALGGWGGRFNLYPQESYFNNTAWKIVESAVTDCIRKGQRIRYKVDLDYGWFQSDVTPNHVWADVTWLDRNKQIAVHMGNEPVGGPYGDASATDFKRRLIAQGC